MPSIGTSIAVIAAGAILRYAVTARTEGFSLPTAGLILIILGGVGLVLSVLWMFGRGRRRRAVVAPVEEPVDGYEERTRAY